MAKDTEKALSKEELKAKKKNEKLSMKATASKQPKKSFIKYCKDVKSEFKKVIWPSKKQVFNNTCVVLAMIIVSGLAIWAMDSAFVGLISLMLGLS